MFMEHFLFFIQFFLYFIFSYEKFCIFIFYYSIKKFFFYFTYIFFLFYIAIYIVFYFTRVLCCALIRIVARLVKSSQYVSFLSYLLFYSVSFLSHL